MIQSEKTRANLKTQVCIITLQHLYLLKTDHINRFYVKKYAQSSLYFYCNILSSKDTDVVENIKMLDSRRICFEN